MRSGGFPCHVCSQLNRVGAEVCFNCGANLLPQEEEQPAEDEAARLEPLEPLLVKSATKWLAIANALTVGGAAMLIATVILGFVQAITVTAPLFGDNAVASSASELAKNGLHHALPAWIGPLGFLGLGLVLAGTAITFWALNPHTAVERLDPPTPVAGPRSNAHWSRLRRPRHRRSAPLQRLAPPRHGIRKPAGAGGRGLRGDPVGVEPARSLPLPRTARGPRPLTVTRVR